MNYFVHDLNPVAFTLFGAAFPYYWLVYFLGYFFIVFYIKWLIKKEIVEVEFDKFFNYLFFGFLVLLLSGKLFYVLFYNLNYYIQYPQKIFALWEGGMSFHGALLGCAIWTLAYSKVKNISFWKIADPVVTGVPFVLFFGRMANFINGELAGRVTDVSWAVVFPKLYDMSPRHPSQIYEALLEGIALFTILHFRKSYIKIAGIQTASFLFFYGLFRFIVEFFRMPDKQIGLLAGFITVGQLYCLIMMVVGVVIYLKKRPTS